MKELSDKSLKLTPNAFISSSADKLRFCQLKDREENTQKEICTLRSISFIQCNQQESLDSEIMNKSERKKKELYLDDLQVDLADMPSCARKTIMELLVRYEQKLLGNSKSSQPENLVTASLEQLKDQIKREDLFSKDTADILRDLKMDGNINNFSSIVGCLNTLLQNIRPLNVPEIKRLVLKAKKAAELIHKRTLFFW